MKKLIFLTALLPLLFVNCGGTNSEDATDLIEGVDTLELDFSDMDEMSLSPDGLNMKIMLPSVASSTGASIEPQVLHDDGDYLWYINIGKRFKLVVEDFGKEQNKVAAEKERLGELESIFDISYLVDESALVMYRRTLHEGQGGKTTYHCFGEVIIDGYTYVLRSEQEGSLKPIIEDMVKTIRSASPTEMAS